MSDQTQKIAAEAAETQVRALEERGFLDFDSGEQEDRASVVTQLAAIIQSAIEKDRLERSELLAFADGYESGVSDSAAHAREQGWKIIQIEAPPIAAYDLEVNGRCLDVNLNYDDAKKIQCAHASESTIIKTACEKAYNTGLSKGYWKRNAEIVSAAHASADISEIEAQLESVIKCAARCGSSGSGYVIDVMHNFNVEDLQKEKSKLLNLIKNTMSPTPATVSEQ